MPACDQFFSAGVLRIGGTVESGAAQGLCRRAVEPMVPTGLSPAWIGQRPPPAAQPSTPVTRTTRVRAVPRCCIRDTTSCPT